MQFSELLERRAELFGVVWNNLHSSVLQCNFLCALAGVTSVFAEWLSLLMVWYSVVLLPRSERMTPGLGQVFAAFWHCSEGLARSNQLWISGSEWLHRRPKGKSKCHCEGNSRRLIQAHHRAQFSELSVCDLGYAWVSYESYWQVTEILGGCMASHFV